MINIKIRLFAAFKELIGKNQIELKLPENSSIKDAVKALELLYPAVKSITPISKFAVNMEYSNVEYLLSDGDEITIIMPVSGGIFNAYNVTGGKNNGI